MTNVVLDEKEGGYFLIDKPLGWTSFQAVNKIKHWAKHNGFPKLKIGHAGTLDPLATGLLIVCYGKFTKKIEEFQAKEKEYTGTFVVGATTPCFDMEKPVDCYFETEHITSELLQKAVSGFLGEQNQVPPVFSAVKVQGKRAFDYARSEQDVVLEAKKIFIEKFDIEKYTLPNIDFRIVCSKGTYIRAIARDLGVALNSGAYLSRLRRERIGEFHVKDAIGIECFVSQRNKA